MDLSAFALCLRDAIIGAFQEFHAAHARDSPYGFAIIEGQGGNYLGYAIATEEGLLQIATKYADRGYRYQGWSWEKFENEDRLASWLRWANPDDGWHYGDLPDRFQIQQHLDHLCKASAFGENAEELEEFCTEVLASLQSDLDWRKIQGEGSVIVGVTEGVNPRDFLRTATRCNPYRLVRRLWWEHFQAEELCSRIRAPD